MQPLNLPPVELMLRNNNQRVEVFDIFRKRYVTCTPEEWVRQHLLHFLIQHRRYPEALIAVEKSLNINGLHRRFDAVVFNREAQPILVVECKAPAVNLTQPVFDQICAYNSKLNVEYLLISNGLQHVCLKKNHAGNFGFLHDIPEYSVITN
ncbi:MAG TPA: type I restriction enzyme HsdR N-terminal domain-containing protein [Bacteroidales bacterium]|nr:type I restriction enzyme HsdR N-terminal domain-containing protein [Bacteroidales bacterium]HOE04636.1 type I restriction enzyme HsdR N-terminal domain-containing protein [Bacteroidales bacterium]HQL71474.1 type I restriction enzyme HsdR N-terminal domain-containing protein [Bacteroidales bacterium]